MKISLMLHSILTDVRWDYGFLANREGELLLAVRALRRLGFTFDKVSNWSSSRGRTAYLTFDDGFADNWTLLFPLLERLGIPFTIFVCKDFVENSDKLRPFGAQVPGYLSRAEIIAMHKTGLVDIQSHSATHTWYPTGLTVEALFANDSRAQYPWVLWNKEPEAKPYWLTRDYSEYHGAPVLVNDRSLRARRVVVDDDKWEKFVNFARTERATISTLNSVIGSFRLGRPETEAEQYHRYLREFKDNETFIRDLVGVRPSVFCWPGGAYNEVSLGIAKELGYIHTQNVNYGRDANRIHRISPVNIYGRDRLPWRAQNLMFHLYLARFAFGSLRSTRFAV